MEKRELNLENKHNDLKKNRLSLVFLYFPHLFHGEVREL